MVFLPKTNKLGLIKKNTLIMSKFREILLNTHPGLLKKCKGNKNKEI